VIFAERSRRSEGLVFRLAYQFYRAGHWALVGRGIRFGNFSAVPRFALDRLVHVSELWNHYAAAVLKARLPHVMIPTNRATRLDGKSKMRTVALVTHGLSAISVNGEIVGSRLLMATSGLVGLALAGMIVVLAIRLSTQAAIPGWTTYTLALLFIIFVQAIMAALMFAFVTLNGRNSRGFLPSKDYPDYITSAQDLPLARAPATGQGTAIRR
jgi:polyisoprenyl-phosphate glycosyltransferase